MKIFAYTPIAGESVADLCSDIEANLPILIANMDNEEPIIVHGFIDKDKDSVRICIYEEADIVEGSIPTMTVYSSDISSDLDNFMINKGYSKIS